MFKKIIEYIEKDEAARWETRTADLFAISETKKTQVAKLFYDLTVYLVAIEEYTESGKARENFDMFLNKLKRKEHPHIEFIANVINKFNNTGIDQKIDNFPKRFANLFSENAVLNNVTLLLSESYNQPWDPTEIQQHLWAAFVYFCLPFSQYPILSDLRMDIALSKLSFMVGIIVETAHDAGKYIYRAKTTQEKVLSTKNLRQKEVGKYYERIDPRGHRPYEIASLIRQQMPQWSIRTIRRDLKELGLC